MKRSLSGLMLLLLACGSANAALLSRAGGQAYYDDVLDITWVSDANLAATNNFGVSGTYDGSNPNGSMTWAKANEWIGAMNTANYLGTNTWRLPTVEPLNGSTFNYLMSYNGSTDRGYNQSEQSTAYAGSTASEMAHLYYNTLNNKGYCTPSSVYPDCTIQAGSGLSNTGPFSNLQPWLYWSGTEFAPVTSNAWYFNFNTGYQHTNFNKGYVLFAWAVSPGDSLAVVPLPGSVWMLGSALGALRLLRRKVRNRDGLVALPSIKRTA